MIRPFHRIHLAILHALLAGMLVLTALGCKGAGEEVVVYTSVDQPFSEPILKDFERETGVAVKAIFDTEEAKSTGVMNRLLAEKDNAQADVYWANEPIRAEFLKLKGAASPYASPNAEGIPAAFKDPEHYWTGFSARARVLIIGNQVSPKPTSVMAYLEPRFKDRSAIANPLFGTTTAYAAALFTLWGDEKTKSFFEAMKTNGVRITASNGDSADLVAAGESEFALVDSDDAFNRTQQGKPVSMVVPDQGEGEVGVLLLPTAVLLVKGAPHAATGKKLIDYLLSKETEKKLAFADCAQIPLHAGVETPPNVPRIEALNLMALNVSAVAREM
ncbi:MAG: extracellular solute-binding protein, partial [Acidobacteria bacterium]|nr:extracellular solute-binding protein [Acidobacteriota bacterium]